MPTVSAASVFRWSQETLVREWYLQDSLPRAPREEASSPLPSPFQAMSQQWNRWDHMGITTWTLPESVGKKGDQQYPASETVHFCALARTQIPFLRKHTRLLIIKCFYLGQPHFPYNVSQTSWPRSSVTRSRFGAQGVFSMVGLRWHWLLWPLLLREMISILGNTRTLKFSFHAPPFLGVLLEIQKYKEIYLFNKF